MNKASTDIADQHTGYKKDNGIDNRTFQCEDENLDRIDRNVSVAAVDPWALPELKVHFTPWPELNGCQKSKRMLLHYILKIVLLLAALYLFICSLGFMGDAFKLLGVITVKLAIPIVMGANIGTSITNTIVSLGQIANKEDFRRAFAGATVHDVFNWLTVLVLLPLEVVTGYLERLSGLLVESLQLHTDKEADKDFLQVIVGPFTKLIIQIDKNVIENIAKGKNDYLDKSILKTCCDKTHKYINESVSAIFNGTLVNSTKELQASCKKSCEYLFRNVANVWSDAVIGAVLLVLALSVMCLCLISIVKLLHSLLKGQMAVTIRKFVNANLPGKVCGYFTGYLAILIGAGFTVLIQSSSVFTSSLTPLVGMGVISLDRMYPLTLGSNIGTTATGILAALAQDVDKIPHALQIAFCHLFFNISGTAIFYPFPFLRLPVDAAKFLGTETSKYRWFSIVYLFLIFFIIPGVAFALSEVSWIALAAVFVPIFVVTLVVIMIKCIQAKKPGILPRKLQDWKWLPEPLRSLEPYNRVVMRATGNFICCRKCGCCKGIYNEAVHSNELEYRQDGDERGTVVSRF